jgi:hypothetical protein
VRREMIFPAIGSLSCGFTGREAAR